MLCSAGCYHAGRATTISMEGMEEDAVLYSNLVQSFFFTHLFFLLLVLFIEP